jgi:hypothetical protein
MRTFVVSLLILIPPALMNSAPDRGPDPTTVPGHLMTCPDCRDLESNPLRCREAREIARRIYTQCETDRRPR